MASSVAAQAAGQGADELRDLREQLLALHNTESELRLELRAARAQLAQLAQNEAMARSLLKESHSVTRALHERTRLEADAANAELRASLETERAKFQADLARATDELRTRRNRPDAEMETLRALFADLMRGEALGRQRLERLQEQVSEHERQTQELQQQLDLEREARQKAEALSAASEKHEQLGQLKTAVAELEQKHAALGCELVAERGTARAQAEQAAADVESSRERAKAAAESEQASKDALFEVRQQLAQAQEKLREESDERQRAATQFADQVAGLQEKSGEERALANVEIARGVQAVETLQAAVTAASAAATKAAADLEEEKALAARLRDEVGRVESARDAAQEAARDLSQRERRTAVELAETLARAAQLESTLDELRRALAARTDAESAARASAAQLADQVAGLQRKSEEQRALANAEIAKRVQAIETLQGAVTAATAKAAADLEEEKAVAARLRNELNGLESARDAAQAAARDLSLRERRTTVELAETQARATQLGSQLDELGRALAAHTEAESAARAATAQAVRERDEVQRALAVLEAALAELRATSAQQVLTARNELAEAGQLRQAVQQDLTEVRVQLEKSETGRAALEAAVAGLREELHRASDEARAQQDDLVRKVEDERSWLAEAKAEQARLSAEAERLRTSEQEHGRTAEALAGELALARGNAERLQSALDQNGAALASLQARHSDLEADLKKSLHERDEEARSRVAQADVLRDERTQAAGRIADLEAALARKDAELLSEHRARADELETMRALRDAEQRQLAAELRVETTRAEDARRESQGLIARCDTSERELAEAAQRIRAAETDAAEAKAAQERLSAIASVRREALIAELDGRFADAEALLQAELGHSPLEAPVFLQLGRLHYAWAEGAPGPHEEIAERLLARAAELDQYGATAPLYLGHVRLRRGRHKAAREAYREAIDRDAQCAPAHEALEVLSVRSMKRQARIAFGAAIALLLISAALLIHQFVQGPVAPPGSALSESQEGRAESEVVPPRRSSRR